MSIGLFFPVPRYVVRLPPSNAVPITLRALCTQAGVTCRASGTWTQRLVYVEHGEPAVTAEASPRSAVLIRSSGSTKQERFRYALAALAFALMDLVARESIRSQAWAQPAQPRGRPRGGTALNTRERQRRHLRNKDRRISSAAQVSA